MEKKKKLNVKNIKRKEKATNIAVVFVRTFLIVGLSFVILFPILSALIPSITSYSYLGEPNSIWLPLKTSGLSYKVARDLINYNKSLPITILFSLSMAIVQVAVSVFVGYGFAMMRSKVKKVLFFMVVLIIIVPAQALTVPQYLYFSKLKLLGNLGSLYLLSIFGVGLKSGLFIYLFKQYFEGLPKELEEAATMDGCGFVGTFFRVMLPNATSIMLTVFVFSFIWNFGDVYYSSWFANESGLLAPQIKNSLLFDGKIKGEFVNNTLLQPDDMPELFPGSVRSAGIILYITPLAIFYMVIQRKFVQGFERSGLTGQ